MKRTFKQVNCPLSIPGMMEKMTEFELTLLITRGPIFHKFGASSRKGIND
jgi:hypothetical protein